MSNDEAVWVFTYGSYMNTDVLGFRQKQRGM